MRAKIADQLRLFVTTRSADGYPHSFCRSFHPVPAFKSTNVDGGLGNDVSRQLYDIFRPIPFVSVVILVHVDGTCPVRKLCSSSKVLIVVKLDHDVGKLPSRLLVLIRRF